MANKPSRSPVKNLYLPGIRLPVGGVVSILHRISGILLVFSIPAFLWLLQQSLTGAEEFNRLLATLRTVPVRLLLLAFLLILVHHLFAGIRHLLLDLDVGISRQGSQRGAWLVLTGVMIILVWAGGVLFR